MHHLFISRSSVFRHFRSIGRFPFSHLRAWPHTCCRHEGGRPPILEGLHEPFSCGSYTSPTNICAGSSPKWGGVTKCTWSLVQDHRLSYWNCWLCMLIKQIALQLSTTSSWHCWNFLLISRLPTFKKNGVLIWIARGLTITFPNNLRNNEQRPVQPPNIRLLPGKHRTTTEDCILLSMPRNPECQMSCKNCDHSRYVEHGFARRAHRRTTWKAGQ